MGRIKHHAIIVTAGSDDEITRIHAKAFEMFEHLCSEVIDSKINGYSTFFIAPDGSKEGWEDSDHYDQQRSEFKKWISRYDGYSAEVVEIYYGGDEPDLKGIRKI